MDDLWMNAPFFDSNFRPRIEERQVLWFAYADFPLPGSYLCNFNKYSSFNLFYNTLWLECINKIIKCIANVRYS